MLRPAYRLTIGDQIIDTTDEPKASTTVDLVVRLSIDTPADSVVVMQGQVGGAEPSPEDDLSVGLGYDGEHERVFTGRVVDVVPGLETKRILGLSVDDLLLRHHENETFEEMSAGDVVRELASRAGVDVERADDGVALPAFVVDGRRSVGAHIHDLAALSGYDTYTDADGGLVFEEFAGQRTEHRLRHGVHVLSVDVRTTRPVARAVEVWGESPGASRGTESWAWLTKDFEPWRGSAGSGSPTMLLERSAIRTAESAIASATRTNVGLGRATRVGTVRVQGHPGVHLGELVRLEGFTRDDLDGNYQVRTVEHRISKAGGFVTEIGIRSVGELAS